MGEEIQEDVQAVFQKNMETQEEMADLMGSYDNHSIAEAALDVAESLIVDIQNPELEKYVWVTTLQLGKASDSQEVMEYASTKIQQWAQEHANANPEEMA